MPPLDCNIAAPLAACAHDRLPPNVALMQMVQAAANREQVDVALQEAIRSYDLIGDADAVRRLSAIARLWNETPQAWAILRAVLAEAGSFASEGAASIERWAEIFDRACALSPEAGVALYSLGRADLLDAATAEIAALMRQWNLLGLGKSVLDLGCGAGRCLQALAGEVGFIIGVDISMAMLREARRRCTGLAGVTVLRSSGRDLAMFADASFDLVYAVDSFPYLVQVGDDLVRRHIAEAARMLKPGGNMVIFNYSYRGNRDLDRADLASMSQNANLQLVAGDGTKLRHWDGAIYRLRR